MHPSRQVYIEDAPDDEVSRAAITQSTVAEQTNQDADMGGIDLANVPIDRDHFVQNTPGAAPEKASAILAEFSRKKFAAQIAVPTDDKKVRVRLRELAEPITLFGEGPADRRDRLRDLLVQIAEGTGGDVVMGQTEQPDREEHDFEEEYYTQGSSELLTARKDIARYSLPRAKTRLAFQRAEATIPLREHVKFRKTVKEKFQGIYLLGSQMASDRPLSSLRFAPNGETIAVGSWSGNVKLFDKDGLTEKMLFRGHNEIVSGLSWMPGATLAGSQVSRSSVNLATGGGEGSIHLWSLEQDTPLATLSGHSARVAKVEFHPSGRYLASASYDCTWRLWDVETGTELLMQEGHSRDVHTIAINEDGSLIASAGLDSIGRIWDLRTGKFVMYIDSHMQPIYALDWSTDGYRVLSGSADGFMKCWDVRAVRESASIGAHSGGVTDIRWFKAGDGPPAKLLPEQNEKGDYLPKLSGSIVVTAGFDKTVKIFSADDWALYDTLKGHDGNVAGVDITADGLSIASAGRDRTLKLWGKEDYGQDEAE
jgi:U4/U6 small nuclear ribonucleoprotein PRP4